MKTALVTLTLSLISLHAQAGLPGGMSMLNQQAATLAKAEPRVMAEAPVTCTNFTGEWSGNCQEGGDAKPTKLKIQQEDCASIKFDGKSTNLGEHSSSTTVNPIFFMNMNSNSRFTKDGQAVASYAAGVMDSGYFEEPYFLKVTTRMTKSGENTIKVDGKMQVHNNSDLQKEVPFSCELTKSL